MSADQDLGWLKKLVAEASPGPLTCYEHTTGDWLLKPGPGEKCVRNIGAVFHAGADCDRFHGGKCGDTETTARLLTLSPDLARCALALGEWAEAVDGMKTLALDDVQVGVQRIVFAEAEARQALETLTLAKAGEAQR